MTVIATCNQCGTTKACDCGVTGVPIMPDHDNPQTDEHCPGSDHIGLMGVS